MKSAPRRVGFGRTIVLAALLGAASVGPFGGPFGGSSPAQARDSAVVIMYHRFGESEHPATNIRVDQFEGHVKELTGGRMTVLGVPEILARLRAGETLPDDAVGITIDDAFRSVYTVAWPRLRAAGLPFTLFVATDAVDRATEGYMNWDQIRELRQGGVTIGSQTASHLHMAKSSPGRNAEDLARSNARFRAELGAPPTLIAYPYGEYSLAVRDKIVEAGFTDGFGQHSGVLHKDMDRFFMPRFAMNEAYGDIARLRLAVKALPLRVRDVTPADPLLSDSNNPPHFGFTVFGDAVKGLRALNCYASGQGRARIDRLGRSRIEVRFERPFLAGRARINCTMPASRGRWRWYGMQFYVPAS